MDIYAKPIEQLIKELTKLPGIGEKTALRLVMHILHSPSQNALDLAQSIIKVREEIILCSTCFTYADKDPCSICGDEGRNEEVVCVVEDPADLMAIERTHEFKGKYHVLHGVISPFQGSTPEKIKVKELLARIKEGKMKEVIVATNPNVEGETTAIYLTKLIKPYAIKITRIAQGIPMGGELEYIDQVTLVKALEGRREL